MFDLIDSEKCFSKGISPYKLISGEFDVCSPYFQAKKRSTEPPHKRQKSNTERETEERHQTIRTQLVACLDQLAEQWPANWKERQTPTTQDTETETVDFPSMQQMVEMAQLKFSFESDKEEECVAIELEDQTIDLFSVFGTVYRNSSDDVRWLPLTMTANYLIPPHSTFLMGSMLNTIDLLGNYVETIGGADLIVMDPPWPNKSVHRSSHYDTQDIYDLYKIPMLKLISKRDSLVAIWVTNKPKFRKFMIDKLLPAWQLRCVAEWVWLKTTTQAESVCPLDSTHKKPYEQLILARPIHSPSPPSMPKTHTLVSVPSTTTQAESVCPLDSTHKKPYEQLILARPIHSPSPPSMPKTHTLVSVPSVRHSRKPPLEDVLLPWIDQQEPVCLELFARCLMPGWISWGNECLRFQHANYFQKQ
ncbi:Methyltransferase-like protein 4 [Choanephora cucurbitarum]|uniref:Methyltransferase-like protein 4 n=1 Tax=Choanephora cucurbitarum TaxID=101091 RepID=A0A1C7MY58_9FUNG|nr:Methyltransferase-like protein 4 [Choanephora cucurbitarum]